MQASVATAIWGSLPKMRLWGLPPALLLALGWGSFPPHSGSFCPQPPAPCLLCERQPVLTAEVSARLDLGSMPVPLGHLPDSLGTGLVPPPTSGLGRAALSLLPPLGRRKGLCLTTATSFM